jgi:hypothetical protein
LTRRANREVAVELMWFTIGALGCVVGILWWRTVSTNAMLDVIKDVLDGSYESCSMKPGLRSDVELLQKHLNTLWGDVYGPEFMPDNSIKLRVKRLYEHVFPPRRRKTDKKA